MKIVLNPNQSFAASIDPSLYLGGGILDQGMHTSMQVQYRRHSYGYLHLGQQFKGEDYRTDSIFYLYRIYKDSLYRLQVGTLVGLEGHPKSDYFNRMYGVTTPMISIVREYLDLPFQLQGSMYLGKSYTTLKQSTVGAPYKGYEPFVSTSLGFAVLLR
jgi:hypothetical protein